MGLLVLECNVCEHLIIITSLEIIENLVFRRRPSVSLRSEKMAREINSIVVRYMSWRAQLVRVLVRKAKGPGSSPGTG